MSDEIVESFVPEEAGAGAEAKALPGQAAADPIATGLVFSAVAHHPDFVAEAVDYLRDARALVREQAEKLREEDPIIPVALGEARLRRLSMALRIVFFSIAGLALLFVAAAMIWGAAQSHNVVVEVFDAPPSFVARGISGRTVAAGLLDELTRLRNATRSSYTPLEAQSAWASDIKIIVPDTGISVGEIDRVLHARIGHDLHIQGELMELAAGRIALRVRGDGVAAKSFEGAPGDLPTLTTQAAEWVYGRSQPHEYAAYLTDNGRDKEALEFLPGAFARADNDEQRAALANTWGVAYNDLNRIPEAAAKYRAAMSLKPRYWRAWSNLLAAMPISDGEEATWKEAQAFNAAAAASPVDERPALRVVAPAAVAVRDKMLSIRSQLADIPGSAAGGGTGTIAAASSLAVAYAEVHDFVNARRFADLADPDDVMKKVAVLQVAAEEAIDSGDFTAAVPPLENLRALRKASPLIQSYIYDDCVLGYAYGMAGRAADAATIFADNGNWSECVAWRGTVAAHEGRTADAARIWAGGIGAMPDLPESYLQRGMWRASHNDPAGAIADFGKAHAGAPHYADPLKAWGDVLAASGRRRQALAQYDAALAAAPGWMALKAAREAVVHGL